MDDNEVTDVLLRVRTDDGVKLKYGIARRSIVADALARGEDPDDRRIDWIRSTVAKINEVLLESAEEFNKTYPHDLISTLDMQDTLNTMGTYIRRRLETASKLR